MKRDYRLYIDDLLEAIGKTGKYVEGMSFDKFARGKNPDKTTIRKDEQGE